MLWLIQGDKSSDMIVGCNIHHDVIHTPNEYKLWATRPSGKTMVIFASESEQEVTELKRAIDKAIEIGAPVFEIM